MTEKLTIGDIARLAGVSKATVSRVLNHKPDVDPLTRNRILRLIDEHSFTPDFSAMQLAGGHWRKTVSRTRPFPTGFLWGVSTSAYQIEGATAEDGRGPSIWDDFARKPGATYRGETGDSAADHYHHMQEDVDLLASLNLNAYRFSLSWSRILPQGTGAVNERGLDFYDRLVDALLEQQICPVATLYHWDLPLALHERGGWQVRETAYAFADYAEIVARRLGDRVPWWITLNEPWCAAYLGYGCGVHAPGIQDMQAAVNAAHHLLLSHGLALPRLRQHAQEQACIGITLNLSPIFAADESEETLQAVEKADDIHNRWFLDPLFRGAYSAGFFADIAVAPPLIEQSDMALIAAPIDFLGVNYYSRNLVRARRGAGKGEPAYELVVPVPEASYTGTAWEIYPTGLEEVLARVSRDYAPATILVTENGAAFEEQWAGPNLVPDKRRIEYLRDHINALQSALHKGVPVRGYFAWSFMDNYEWADGYSKRFGLVYVDYTTQRRIVKESGRWYAAFIEAQRPAQKKLR